MDFSIVTACGECCEGCAKKREGTCPGCIEAEGRVPEWAESGQCRIYACARAHGVSFCGLCGEFPCEKLPAMIPWNPKATEHLAALRDQYRAQYPEPGGGERKRVKIIEIVGDDYAGAWKSQRTACRGVVLRGDAILLSYETRTGGWMLPGGGLEDGEDGQACCVREVAEETGVVIRPSQCMLEIDEYYEDRKWVNRYFFGEVTGKTEPHLTRMEKEAGMEPRWLPVDKIMAVFAGHAAWAGRDETRRGTYLREYTALTELLKGRNA